MGSTKMTFSEKFLRLQAIKKVCIISSQVSRTTSYITKHFSTLIFHIPDSYLSLCAARVHLSMHLCYWKSILEFSTATSAVLIAKCTKGEKKKKNTGLHKDIPAAEDPFILSYNHCYVSYKYLTSILYWTGTNIDIFSTDGIPLIPPNLHIKLYREEKQMPSLTEQGKKSSLLIQNATKLKKMQSPHHFQQDNNKQITRRDSSLVSVGFYSQVTFFPPKQFRISSASTPTQAHSSRTSFCSFEAT